MMGLIIFYKVPNFHQFYLYNQKKQWQGYPLSLCLCLLLLITALEILAESFEVTKAWPQNLYRGV